MLDNKELKLMKLKNRYEQLSKKPENARLAAKVMRQIRKLST